MTPQTAVARSGLSAELTSVLGLNLSRTPRRECARLRAPRECEGAALPCVPGTWRAVACHARLPRAGTEAWTATWRRARGVNDLDLARLEKGFRGAPGTLESIRMSNGNGTSTLTRDGTGQGEGQVPLPLADMTASHCDNSGYSEQFRSSGTAQGRGREERPVPDPAPQYPAATGC